MRTKLHASIMGLALWTVLYGAQAQVTNPLVAPAGQQSIIYWPNDPTNYVLQTITNLTSTNWVGARTAYAVNMAAVTDAASAGYFRLQPLTVPAGMALIPAGWFTMGDTLDGATNAIPTNVYVSAFAMDVNLVTYGLWTNVYTYAMSQGYSFADTGTNGATLSGGTGTNYPVVAADWYDCVKWCNARSQQTDLTPVYCTDTNLTQVYTNGETDTVYVNWSATGYRLPTEAEWEKAARGGGIGRRYPWGNLIHTTQAQYFSPAKPNTLLYDLGPAARPSGPSPVGSFDVNGYGLYDMAGNVLEWCWDWYGTPYGQPTAINPTGAGSGSGARVLRGGKWSANSDNEACAFRLTTYHLQLPGEANDHIGLRCVRGL